MHLVGVTLFHANRWMDTLDDDKDVCINHGTRIRQDIIPIIATLLVWPQKNTTEQQQRELNLCLKGARHL
jgi:hypothetical protein